LLTGTSKNLNFFSFSLLFYSLFFFCGGSIILHSWRVGDPEKPQVQFGELFDDEQTQQHYEGLAATLKAAKKRGIVTYKSPILLKGAHDKVMVNLVDTSPQGESKTTTTTTNNGASSKEE
jgi:hypothetical protein